MLAFLARIKTWPWVAAIIVALGVAVKFLADSRARWKDKAHRAEEELEWQDDLRTIEVRNEAKSKERRENAEKEMADGKVPSIFKRHTR